MKPSKYRNIKTEVDGFTFDSRAEARRWHDLRMMERAGEIRGLVLQPKYPLIVNGVPIKNSRGRVRMMIADFAYITKENILVVEDVKGKDTEISRLKRDIFHTGYPDIKVSIVK